MRLVLDSSVAFKWRVAERDSDKALVLRDEFIAGIHEPLAPDIFPVEVTHSLTRAERQGRVTRPEGQSLFFDFLTLLPDLHPYLPLLPRAFEISSLARQGVYDCIYVALAEREGCEFLTADDKLINNLRPLFPFITPLASLP